MSVNIKRELQIPKNKRGIKSDLWNYYSIYA